MQRRRRVGREKRSIAGDVVRGALAGAVATWAMDRVGWSIWHRQSDRTLEAEIEARVEAKDPAHVVANRTARAVGTRLHPEQPHVAGIAVHYAIGIAPALLYAPLRRRVPAVAAGAGLAYGTALFLAVDEGLVPAMGLASGPHAYPWQAHARGLATHLVLGAVTHATLEVLDRAT